MIHELALHTTTPFRFARLVAIAAWALVLAAKPASAQRLCAEEDAGLCEEDAGVDASDAGSDAGAAPDGGGGTVRDGGGGAGEGVACSCHTDTEFDRGARIHVCTESFDLEVCADFDCERGTVRSRGCPEEGVKLCCVMRSRDLQTSLYEDCAHPNCESGFREQCREFGGTVSEGACESPGGGGAGPGGGDDDDSDSGFCAVSAPGGAQPGRASWLLPSALALLALRITRRRAAASRARRPAPSPRPA